MVFPKTKANDMVCPKTKANDMVYPTTKAKMIDSKTIEFALKPILGICLTLRPKPGI